MGITFDIIPLGPDEAPQTAIDRIYGGGLSIEWTETDTGWEATDHEIPRVEMRSWTPPPGWSDGPVERIAALYDWNRDDERGRVYFWLPWFRWQVEFNPTDVTLRRRSGTDSDTEGPSDAQILRAFDGVPAIVHFPDNDWWMRVDEAEDDLRLI